MLLGLLYRIIGDYFSYIGDIGDIGGTTMAGLVIKTKLVQNVNGMSER